MPCKCGATRIIYEKMSCPVCESIPIADPTNRIQTTKRYLQEALSYLNATLCTVNPELLVERLMVEREEAAMRCLTPNLAKEEPLKRWLSISFILSKYPWAGSGLPDEALVEYLISSAEEILEYQNEILKLQKNLSEITLIDGEEEIVPTEFDVLYTIPPQVLKEFEKNLFFSKVLVDDGGDEKSFDLLFVREAMVQPGLPLIIGDEVFRCLKKNYSYRLLPLVTPSNADRFIEIGLGLAGHIAFQLGRNFEDNYGLLKTDDEFLEGLRSLMIEESANKATWCLNNLENPKGAITNLGQTTVFKTKDGTVYLPYFSIYLLTHLCLRFEKSSEKGEYYRYIGETVEDIIFAFISAYSLNTIHPVTGEPLLRVQHPEKKGEEIADMMAYDDKQLIVLESKFRETLTVKDLEAELTKFQEKIAYISQNLPKFGLPEKLSIKPYFYVPYPPYTEWNGIKLIPSLICLGDELAHFCEPRPLTLAPRSKELQTLLDTINDSTPYPTDVSIFDKTVPNNKYRIQDGVVESYDEEEITTLIDNPIGMPTALVIDISQEIYKLLQASDVKKGDIIKMALLNQNKTWTQVQLVEFKVTGKIKSSSENLDFFGLNSILRVNSGEQAVEKVIFQTWGEKTGKELQELLKKWNIDFPRFIEHQLEKGQNVLIGTGRLLEMPIMYGKLVQCKCGEVMGFSPEFLTVMRTLYPDTIPCKKCDPDQFNKLAKIGYPMNHIDYSTLFEFSIRQRQKKNP